MTSPPSHLNQSYDKKHICENVVKWLLNKYCGGCLDIYLSEIYFSYHHMTLQSFGGGWLENWMMPVLGFPSASQARVSRSFSSSWVRVHAGGPGASETSWLERGEGNSLRNKVHEKVTVEVG